MGIKVNYTPMEATGKLAQLAGKAQQAVRDQQYSETRALQAEQIAANERMQAEQLTANAEEWRAKLASQENLSREQMLREQQARELQILTQKKIAQQQRQQEAEMAEQANAIRTQQMEYERQAREQANEISMANAARLYQQSVASAEQKNFANMLDVSQEEYKRSRNAQKDQQKLELLQQVQEQYGNDPQKLLAATVAVMNNNNLPSNIVPNVNKNMSTNDPSVKMYSQTDLGKITNWAVGKIGEISEDPWFGPPTIEDTPMEFIEKAIDNIIDVASPTNMRQIAAAQVAIDTALQQYNITPEQYKKVSTYVQKNITRHMSSTGSSGPGSDVINFETDGAGQVLECLNLGQKITQQKQEAKISAGYDAARQLNIR